MSQNLQNYIEDTLDKTGLKILSEEVCDTNQAIIAGQCKDIVICGDLQKEISDQNQVNSELLTLGNVLETEVYLNCCQSSEIHISGEREGKFYIF